MILWLASPFWRIILFCFSIVWVRTRRPNGSAQANITIVANHVTMIDGATFGHVLSGQLTGVALAWVAKVPIVATVAKAHKVLTVQREKTAAPSANNAKVAPVGKEVSSQNDPTVVRSEEPTAVPKSKSATDLIVDYQKQCAADEKLLRPLIFPEGTTKMQRCLLKFRTGAFVSGEPVQPVALRFPDDVGWVHGLGGHIFDLLTRWVTVLDVIFLDPYVPSEAEKSDPNLYAQNVQKLIAEALDLPSERCSMTLGPKEFANLPK